MEGVVLVDYCCCNKLPQTSDLNNTNVLSDSSRDQKSELKSRFWQGGIPVGSPRGDSVSLTFCYCDEFYLR